MSNGLLRWAVGVKMDRSTDKCLLICLANRVRDDKEGTCFPSQAQLAEDSCQDRKTVIAGLKRLCAAQLIADTGERIGATRQVIVWRIAPIIPKTELLDPDNGEGARVIQTPTTDPEPEPLAVNGKNGTVPFLDNKSPVFPVEQSRFSLEGSQKRDTEPKEPKRNPKEPKEPRAKLPTVIIPDWVPSEAWNGYLSMRAERKKAPTTRAVELLIGRLAKLRDDGLPIDAILDESTRNGWTDVYAPKNGKNFQPRGSPREGVRASYATMFKQD